MSKETTAKWNNFVLCIEMLLFAVMLARAFPASEFTAETSRDMHRHKWVKPLKQVMSTRDVRTDIRKNFSRRTVDEGGHRGVPFLEADHGAAAGAAPQYDEL